MGRSMVTLGHGTGESQLASSMEQVLPGGPSATTNSMQAADFCRPTCTATTLIYGWFPAGTITQLSTRLPPLALRQTTWPGQRRP